ncbi:hypothetical protein PSE_p0172 (plasmid) [Pseudovibrio sp. FO-BEG1]|uniref:hypothetical protein n=1 Tax=Pseudovibrio sp. (strain FO-BEG1) TaxID=911045 RepID=UPI000238CBEA|nr:hypothetical protein [Pseudovibrio sp. FO-BEG1]AEV39754.1 hypothetical protein PSE_p0172 [Pseudovibrio sp. FO-BEG1]
MLEVVSVASFTAWEALARFSELGARDLIIFTFPIMLIALRLLKPKEFLAVSVVQILGIVVVQGSLNEVEAISSLDAPWVQAGKFLQLGLPFTLVCLALVCLLKPSISTLAKNFEVRSAVAVFALMFAGCSPFYWVWIWSNLGVADYYKTQVTYWTAFSSLTVMMLATYLLIPAIVGLITERWNKPFLRVPVFLFAMVPWVMEVRNFYTSAMMVLT